MEKDDRITPETMHRYCCLDEVDPALDSLVKHEVRMAELYGNQDGFKKGLIIGITIGLSISAMLLSILRLCLL